MNLGSSIRRRRAHAPRKQKKASSQKQAGSRERRRRRRRTSLGGAARRAGLALGIALAGVLAGYQTTVFFFFPPQESPVFVREVPDLRGMTNAAALHVLDSVGLSAGGLDSIHHPRAPRGTVIGQSPLPGPTASRGAEVRLAVSTGPLVRLVPDVTRLSGDRAVAVLAAAGLDVAADTVESFDPAGRVLAMDPPPGDSVSVPSPIRVSVSSGPPTFAMPDLTGMEESRALATLDSLGLVASEVDRRYSLLNQGAVFGQAPAPGESVMHGQAASLVVGEAPRSRLRR